MSITVSARHQAALLTIVGLFDNAVQLFTPILLVRFIDSEAFGYYRAIWLLAGTVALFASLGMSGSLMFFLPRASYTDRGVYVGHTLFVTAIATLIIIGAVVVGSDVLPQSIREVLRTQGALVWAFVFLWTVSSPLNILPNAEQKFFLQGILTVGLSLIRILLVAGSAVWTGELAVIIEALVAFTFLKALILLAYCSYRYGWAMFRIVLPKLREQFSYSLPFGITEMLYGLRRSIDQWIVAALFQPAVFGAFSLAATVSIPFDVLRAAAANVILPRMSKSHGEGDIADILMLNKQAATAVNTLIYPGLAIVFVFADQIVLLLFGENYQQAVPVIRVYMLQAALTLEVGALMRVHSQGIFSAKATALNGLVSAVSSYVGAKLVGATGAALGSLFAAFFALAVNHWRLSVVMGVPVAHLQPWRQLTVLASSVAISAILPWICFSYQPLVSGRHGQLAAGTIVLVATYLLILWWTGNGKLFELIVPSITCRQSQRK